MVVGQRTQAVNALRGHAAEFGVVAAKGIVSQVLAEIPGVGPIGAITMALSVDAGNFGSGRHFAAWLGLTPKRAGELRQSH